MVFGKWKCFKYAQVFWDTISSLLGLKMSKRTRGSFFSYMNKYFKFHLV